MPSKSMFAVFKTVGGEKVFLAKDMKSWTTDYLEIMFYAYASYADLRASRHEGARVGVCDRDERVCPIGGHDKRRQKRTRTF